MIGNTKKRGRRSSPHKLSGWQKSLAFRQMATKSITAHNRKRARLPKCGAKAKSTGQRCGNLAMANGKCWLHGGLTPAGDEWHKMQFRRKPPSRQAPSDWQKVEAKLRKREKEEKDRARRLAAMSPEQRAAYEQHRRTHTPGRPSARAAARERRRQDEEFRRAIAAPTADRTPSPELRALADDIARLRAEQAALTDGISKNDPSTDPGVFG